MSQKPVITAGHALRFELASGHLPQGFAFDDKTGEVSGLLQTAAAEAMNGQSLLCSIRAIGLGTDNSDTTPVKFVIHGLLLACFALLDFLSFLSVFSACFPLVDFAALCSGHRPIEWSVRFCFSIYFSFLA